MFHVGTEEEKKEPSLTRVDVGVCHLKVKNVDGLEVARDMAK